MRDRREAPANRRQERAQRQRAKICHSRAPANIRDRAFRRLQYASRPRAQPAEPTVCLLLFDKLKSDKNTSIKGFKIKKKSS